jgi:hypothetical protein
MTFDQMFEAEQEAKRERAKAIRKIEQPDEEPLHGRTLLKRIISDPNESRSAKQDAQRLLDIAEISPRQFQREFDDFLAWQSEHK